MSLERTSPAPPVRIVHLGLGAFSRSHTAWYTAHAADAREWGIAAYTGRSAGLADILTEQDGLYTLVVRSAEGDSAEVIESMVRAHPGDDRAALYADLASPETSIITLTITEAGYRSGAGGSPDLDDPLVAADVAALSTLPLASDPLTVDVHTTLARLLVGLEVRQRAGGGAVAVVSCDNIPDNGGHLRRALLALAESTVPSLAEWCRHNVSFVSSSVDRITPQLSADELDALATRYDDRAPVVTEPFHDWVLSGRFPSGRPRWEDAGARFTDDLGPWEAKKLWLLNGAHTLLASLGQILGHTDVAGAVADVTCRSAVESFWDEAERHLPGDLDVAVYRAALVERFANPRIAHGLAQIAIDSATKLRLRVVPVAERELIEGRTATGCATVFAAYFVACDLGLVPSSAAAIALIGAPASERIGHISPVLAADDGFCSAVEATMAVLGQVPVL